MTQAPSRDPEPSVDRTGFLGRLELVVEDVRAGAVVRDRERVYPGPEIDALRSLGFWSLTVPVANGGQGLGPDTLVRSVMMLAAADGSLGQIPQNHFMTLERIRLTAQPRQREHWLGLVGAGAVLGNAAAEPGERPPGESATALSGGPGRHRLSGRKVYSTGSLLADWIAVQARDGGGRQCTVLVAAGAPGVAIEDDWAGMGQRTTASGTSRYVDVPVDDLSVLAHIDDPVATYRVSALGQLVHAAIDTGIAEGALDEATSLARRAHGGRGSGAAAFVDDVLGMELLGRFRVHTLSARRLVESAADRLAALSTRSPVREVADVFAEVAAAKLVSTRAALAVTSGLFDVGGSSAARSAEGRDRYWRDARTHTLHDAARWKPYTLARWLLTEEVADPWSIAHPYRPLCDLEALA